MNLHRPTGAWYFRGLHQARAFTIGIILKFELLSVRYIKIRTLECAYLVIAFFFGADVSFLWL
jgi:hypothetical protein